MSRTFDLSACLFCGGTGWTTPYSVPRDVRKPYGDLMRVFFPCSDHPPEIAPDKVTIPESEDRYPELGRDFVVVEDVCLASNPAINGCCGDLLCVCSPERLQIMTRVRETDDPTRQVFLVTEDEGEQFTLMAEHGHRLRIRIPKDGWSRVGIRAFPAEATTGCASA